MKILRLIQLALTALLAFGLLSAASEGAFILKFAAVVTVIGLAAVWGIPWAIQRERAAINVTFEDGFKPEMQHTHIALDPAQNRLWIRDPKKGQRYLVPGDIVGIRSKQDWQNGNNRHRIEVQIKDLRDPLWMVLFERHSDRLLSTSKRNSAERDQWFARLETWAGLQSTR